MSDVVTDAEQGIESAAGTPAEAPAGAVSKDGLVADFLARWPQPVLETLLLDRTTARNIVWADDEYVHLGEGFGGDDEVTLERITGEHAHLIKLRTEKAAEHQSKRTKSRAEVFTPSWLCNYMNNRLDEEWFGRPGAFNVEDGASWEPTAGKVEFPAEKGRGWGDYVRSTRLEITCGEAPFLCSRYDTVTGETIPVPARVGVLDRKLRVVGEHARSRAEWAHAALAALKATYGYEYQGDNLLIARINVLEAMGEHYAARWGEPMSADLAAEAAEVVSWNLWQMDGLRATAPTNAEDALEASVLTGEPVAVETPPTRDLFGLMDEGPASYRLRCVIKNWKANEPFEFAALKGQASQMAKKFYAVIGNPPYQADKDDNSRKPPIYNYFMDEAYAAADRVELITPARFLFDAGQTPKEWNRRMLSDPHLKVLKYEPDASAVFADTDIKGGVAVTYHDVTAEYDPINVFVVYPEMDGTLKKVLAASESFLSDQVTGAVPYRFSEQAQREHPELVELMGKSRDLRTNALDNLYEKLFFKKKPAGIDCASIYGLLNKTRECLWIARDYIDVPDNFDGCKILLPKAIGSGTYGEKLPEIVTAPQGVGHTQSFVSIGNFNTEVEAESLAKYLRTKFARSLLGILKVTQDVTPRVWQYVPLQDFTPASDIDWSKSVAEIDQQLYAKYGLDDSEIEFIETHVKEMS